MNRYRVFLILSAIILASCTGTAPNPDDWDNYDWCYYYSFGEEWYADFIPDQIHIAGESGSYTEIGTGGFKMYQGELSIPPLNIPTNFNISVSRVEIYIERAENNEFEDNTGNIPLYGAANIHGWEIVANDTLPNIGGSDVMFGALAFNRDFGVYAGTNTIFLDLYSYSEGDGQALEDRKNIILNEIRIYGQGESPFSVNPCGDVRPTSTPIASNTPAGTPTGIPACWGQEWDFAFNSLEFSGAARVNGYGFRSSLEPDGITTSISISRALEEPSPVISYIRIRYRVTEPSYYAGDISLFLDGIEVASQNILDAMPNANGDRFLGFDLRPLLFSFDDIEVSAIVGVSSPPAGEIFIEGIELFGLGVAPEPSLYLEPSYYPMDCPTPLTNTPAPSNTPTATPTGTPTACFRLDYDFTSSQYNANATGQLWSSGTGFSNVNFHPNNLEWSRYLSLRFNSGSGFWAINLSRIEFDISAFAPGENAGNFEFRTISSAGGGQVVQGSRAIDSSIMRFDMASPISIREAGMFMYVGRDLSAPMDTDPGGQLTISGMRIWGTGVVPSGWFGAVTYLPCWDITPTPTVTGTLSATPYPATSTRTSTPTPTRTPIPTLPSATPTNTPVVVFSPTPTPTRTITNTPQPPTATKTPTPTRTPTPSRTPTNTPIPPTDTPIPLPTATGSTSTPISSNTPTPIMTATPTGIEPYDFGEIPGPVTFGTLIGGTPDYSGTTIPVPDSLNQYHDEIYNNLGTAAAQINALPADIGAFVPDTSVGLGMVSQYAKWIVSGVSLQELFGARLYVIFLHAFYGLLIAIAIKSIDLIVWLIVLIIKFIVWIVQKILDAIPFIG